MIRLLGLLFITSLMSFANPLKSQRPNIILIIGDDISWNDFGFYGHPTIKTPNLDKIASEGLVFNNAYLTISSCSPTRCSLITGRYPHNNGPAAEMHLKLPNHLLLFPKILKESGYFTAQEGKWHIGGSGKSYFEPDMPAIQAFDEIGGGYFDPGMAGQSGAERWVERIRKSPKNKPFFYWFASHDAHLPFTAMLRKNPNLPENVQVPPFLVDTPLTRQWLSDYYNEITRLDYFIGEVFKELKNQKIDQNTIIIFIADNGRPFPRCKGTLYDSGIKTPLIVWGPKDFVKGGSITNSLVSIIDIAPTVLDLAGIKSPDEFQGKSFRSLFNEPDKKFRDYVFAEQNWHGSESHVRLVRNDDFTYLINNRPHNPVVIPSDVATQPYTKNLYMTYVERKNTPAQDIFSVPRPAEELYDIKNDPDQLNNLVNKPEYASKLNELRKVYEQWVKETGDSNPEFITPNWYEPVGLYLGMRIKTSGYGTRGSSPGERLNAEYINNSGPF